MKDEVEQILNIELPDVPPIGDYNIDEVLDAEYFFQ
jgi:DNA-directed RNA polymerase